MVTLHSNLRSTSSDAPRNGTAPKVDEKENRLAPHSSEAVVECSPWFVVISFQVGSFQPIAKDHHEQRSHNVRIDEGIEEYTNKALCSNMSVVDIPCVKVMPKHCGISNEYSEPETCKDDNAM